MTLTWVDELEDLADVAAEDLYAEYNHVLDAIAPDGRVWGMAKRTKREQLAEYVALGLHDNEQAWIQWMTERVAEISTALADVDPEVVASIHPWDIVVRYALELASSMETELEREQGRFQEEAEPIASLLGVNDGGRREENS